MDRRQFCRSAVAAGVAAAFLPACGKQASQADTGIAAISLDGAEIELEKAAIKELGDAMSGPVMLSGHPQYDSARTIWNGMHDKRPALIARCLDSNDASQAVSFARDNNLLVAVRGGGHSWPGKSVADGALMLDLSQINTANVDAENQRAFVGGGALLGTLDAAALQHGLITTAGVVSHTGCGGYTLGGGFGRLNRKYGLTIDNVRSAEIITADGQVRKISAENEPDLFWAIRGGGGNFGVVTQFEYQLYPFERNLLCGSVAWPIDQAREVLDFYSDWYRGLSDELYVAPSMVTMPEGMISMEVVYNGDPVAGEKELAPLLAIGKPAANGVAINDYMTLQTGMDGMTAHGVRSYAKNAMVKEITPDLVAAMIEAYQPNPNVFQGSHTAGGAVGRVGELDTAFPHRNAAIMFVFASLWGDPAQDDEMIAATRDWYGHFEPFTGGYYDNIDFDGDEAAGNYGPTYERLSQIKGQFDPGNLFRLNSNIEPAV